MGAPWCLAVMFSAAFEASQYGCAFGGAGEYKTSSAHGRGIWLLGLPPSHSETPHSLRSVMRSVLGFYFVVLVAMFAQITLVSAAPVSSGSRAVDKRICYGDCREAVVDPVASPTPAAPVTSSPIPDAEPLPPSPSPSDPSPDSADSESAEPEPADADSVPPAPMLASPAVLVPAPTEQELLSMVNTMLQLIQAYEVNKAAPAPSVSAS